MDIKPHRICKSNKITIAYVQHDIAATWKQSDYKGLCYHMHCSRDKMAVILQTEFRLSLFRESNS